MLDIKGKSILVTGGSKGLGRALALTLSARGATVVLVARNNTELDETVGEVRRRSGVAFARAFSITTGSTPSYWSMRSSPVRPVSSPRSAFCRLSAKLRPIAITSPTDFIDVLSNAGEPANFSNAKRGTLVTT